MGRPRKEIIVNAEKVSTLPGNAQPRHKPYHPRMEEPIIAALNGSYQLKLLLRRARGRSVGCRKVQCLSRLLVVVESVSLALDGLRRSQTVRADDPEVFSEQGLPQFAAEQEYGSVGGTL